MIWNHETATLSPDVIPFDAMARHYITIYIISIFIIGASSVKILA